MAHPLRCHGNTSLGCLREGTAVVLTAKASVKSSPCAICLGSCCNVNSSPNSTLLPRWHTASSWGWDRSSPSRPSGPPCSSWGPFCSTLLCSPSTLCWDLQSERWLVCEHVQTSFRDQGVFWTSGVSADDPHLCSHLYVYPGRSLSAWGCRFPGIEYIKAVFLSLHSYFIAEGIFKTSHLNVLIWI